jgi:radical SAM protein with 4Fe4S-binding SPASM domain
MTIGLPEEFAYLKVIPSYVCTRGCDYCYNVLLAQETSLDVAKLLDGVDEALRQAPRPVHVELIGGEPLQSPGLDVTIDLVERLSRNPQCAGIVLSTAMVAPDRLSRVIPLLSRVYLSMDLSNSKDNRKRLHIQRLRSVAELCDAHGVDLCLSTVLFGDESADELSRYVEDAKSSGVKSIGFTHRTASPMSKAEIAATVDQYHHLFRLRLAERPEIEIFGSMLDSIELSIIGGSRKAPCECGRNSVVVEPDGTLSPGVCFDHRRGRYSIMQFTQLRSERPAHLLEGMCGTCRLWSVCQGGCVSEAIRLNGSPLTRANLECEIIRGLASLIERDIAALSNDSA